VPHNAQPPLAEKDLVSADEARAILGVSRATLWNLVRRFQIPRYRIPIRGRRVFFSRFDLEKLKQPVRIDQRGSGGR
jgi:predicted DNA-binding transcriptional regulator AlpA